MIEVDDLLSFCVVCRSTFRGDGCEWCHYNFFKPTAPFPPTDDKGPLKAIRIRPLPWGWRVGHGLERVCAFIAYYNRALDCTVLTCCRAFGSIILVEVQFWKAKTLVHAMSFDDFQTANSYALEYMQSLANKNDKSRFREYLMSFIHKQIDASRPTSNRTKDMTWFSCS